MRTLNSMVVATVLAFGAGLAQADDVFLEFGTVKGEAGGGNGSTTVTVDSWSWGVHKAGNSTSRAAGQRVAASADAAGVAPAQEAPKAGDMATITVVSKGTDKGCVKGTHFPQVVLRGGGQRIEMTDVEVVSCQSTARDTRHELRGHVTLIK